MTHGMWMTIPPVVDLASQSPKQRWKAKQSALRWERRYGRPKEMFTGEMGVFRGLRIIRSLP